MTASVPMAKPSAMIFDVEGTLVDAVPYTLQCWHETLERAGHPVAFDALRDRSGMDGHDMLRELLPDVPDESRKAILKTQGEAYRKQYLPRVTAFPGIRPLFENIKQTGVKVGLATDCSRDELDRYLEITGIRDLLDGWACGDDAKHGKPHTDLLVIALKRLDVSAESASMVGDTPYDSVAARQLGLTAIGVLTGGFTETRLRNAGASFIYPTAADLSRSRNLSV
jgi:phosphoglycolate phosphatase-like HAD superfamily hydrolase